MTASTPEAPGPALAARIGVALAVRGETGAALIDAERAIPLAALASHSFVAARTGALAGASVLVATRAVLAAALALSSLDGVARRLVLCPPDLDADALDAVLELAEIDAVVGDAEALEPFAGRTAYLVAPRRNRVAALEAHATSATEWVLFTSGTSGAPKLAVHTLEGLAGAMPAPEGRAQRTVWATFYDIRRYGGLQMLLRAMTGGHTLVLADPGEPVGKVMQRIGRNGATHVSGTPTHWRRALMDPGFDRLAPRYVRLSGEIADQAILDALKRRLPEAVVSHAYASTEAGVGFEVSDGLEGFPVSLADKTGGSVQLRIVDGVLQLRSARAAQRYLGQDTAPIRGADGFVDTGDLVVRRGDRYHFVGRRSGIISVGGLKVHPEEVEAVINACPGVRMSRVSSRRSPILGALVAAEVLADADADQAVTRAAILERCTGALAPHKVPVTVRFVAALAMGAGGKLERPHA